MAPVKDEDDRGRGEKQAYCVFFDADPSLQFPIFLHKNAHMYIFYRAPVRSLAMLIV